MKHGEQLADGTHPPCPAIATIVLNHLDHQGFAYIRESLTPAAFDGLSRELGEILLTTQIRIDADLLHRQASRRARGDRPSTYQAEALDFHTDNPAAHFLAWHCLHQDLVGGTLYLLDTGNIADHFTASELEILATIHIEHSNIPGPGEPEKMLRSPLVRHRIRRHHIHYQQWLLLEDYSVEQQALLDRFKTYLNHLAREQPIEIRLEPNESLFIDNHRLLHGRGPLPSDSRRHLVRHFIRRR